MFNSYLMHLTWITHVPRQFVDSELNIRSCQRDVLQGAHDSPIFTRICNGMQVSVEVIGWDHWSHCWLDITQLAVLQQVGNVLSLTEMKTLLRSAQMNTQEKVKNTNVSNRKFSTHLDY